MLSDIFRWVRLGYARRLLGMSVSLAILVIAAAVAVLAGRRLPGMSVIATIYTDTTPPVP
jgi:hypothetical protein